MPIVYVDENEEPSEIDYDGPLARLMALAWETLPAHLRTRTGDALIISEFDDRIAMSAVEYGIGFFSRKMTIDSQSDDFSSGDFDLKYLIEDYINLHPQSLIVAERHLYDKVHNAKQYIKSQDYDYEL